MKRLNQWKKAERAAKRFCRFGETGLVFAYGSNLSLEQMKSRCPGARAICAGTLFGYRLEFVGFSWGWRGAVANVRLDPGAKVQGILYAGNSLEFDSLDIYEGVPGVYDRTSRMIATEFGPLVAAEVYVHQEPEIKYTPSTSYLKKIGGGYRRERFNPNPLFTALREAHEQNKAHGCVSEPFFRYTFSTSCRRTESTKGTGYFSNLYGKQKVKGKKSKKTGMISEKEPARSTRSGGQVLSFPDSALRVGVR